MPEWLLAHSPPNREFAVASILQEYFDFTVYLPVTQELVKRSLVKRPFLARYLFVKRGTGSRALQSGRHSYLLKFIHGMDGVPWPVLDSVVDRLKEREDSDGFIILHDPPVRRFRRGDQCKVLDNDGYDQWDAIFHRMRGDHRAELFLAHLGRHKVTVPLARVRLAG